MDKSPDYLPTIKFRIRAKRIGVREVIFQEDFYHNNFVKAGNYHSERWNDLFAYTDKFTSSLLYRMPGQRCWRRTELINW